MLVVKEEIFDIVDEEDRIIGKATRRQCHGNPELIHRVAHVLVLNSRGDLLLQKRSLSKDIQPGRWDTSVGGHLMSGEAYRTAAVRETLEELGLKCPDLIFLYHSQIRNNVEAENVATFLTVCDGPFDFDLEEIDEIRFWTSEEIEGSMGQGIFTSNFEEEWEMFRKWQKKDLGWLLKK